MAHTLNRKITEIVSVSSEELLQQILHQLKVMNVQLAVMTEEEVKQEDIE